MSATEIYFYDPNTGTRRLDTIALNKATWKRTRYGGYTEFSGEVSGDREQLTPTQTMQPPQENDRIRVFVNGEIRYSGFVAQSNRTSGDPYSLDIAGNGKFSQVARVPVDGRFISDIPVDLSVAFADFAHREVRQAYPTIFVDVSATNLGITTRIEDAYNKNIGDCFSTFAERFGGVAVYGCDEFPSNVGDTIIDRLYLRPVGSTTEAMYNIPVPGPWMDRGVTVTRGGPDLSKLVNILTITGSESYFPNILGPACNGNVSFERPTFADNTYVTRIFNNSFEFATGGGSPPGWTLYGGASKKEKGLTEGPSHSGDDMIEIDNVGEGIRQTVGAGQIFVPGEDEIITIYARLEKGTDSASFRIRIQWKNGGSNVGSPQDITFTPPDASWRQFMLIGQCPLTTVTGYEVSFECTAKANVTGIVLDDAFAYPSRVVQDGWKRQFFGSAVFNYTKWADRTQVREGRYSVSVDITASDSDGNDGHFYTANRFPVSGNQGLVVAGDFRAWEGTTPGKIRLRVDFFKEDGSGAGTLQQDFTGVVTDAAWKQLAFTLTVPSDAVAAQLRIVFRGSSKVYIDRMMVRSSACPVSGGVYEWIDVGAYRITLRADDTANFSGETFTVSNGRYGDSYDAIQSDAVTDLTTAVTLARAYFREFAFPIAAPVVKITDCPITINPGDTVKLIAEDGDFVSGETNRIFVIAEVVENLISTGSVETYLYLQRELKTTLRLMREVFGNLLNSRTGGGAATGLNSSVYGSGSGGVGVGSGGIDLPVSIADGGTGADNASDARDNLGLGSGLSVTVPLAKLTVLGSDGSLTFTNGILTARTDPT